MEKQNVEGTISNAEISQLILEAKQANHGSTLKLLQLFKKDINRMSQFIRMPKEDAVSHIIVEFLEFIKKS
ncbi:hypothetical protein ACFOQM_06460 [Paenibacillus sp. GCM10012307]|uniref:Helix-turn-helix conjugative transposon-like domain-containing protein n=1 Tax=Paenibacillus roseus TaxID=2798579 RepID=A0A934MUC3_9BACL|nr:hypothetical protein [Paenibacillus roseus]MBJ6360942.1 hypothetical protein [Paenibacillus roseus]